MEKEKILEIFENLKRYTDEIFIKMTPKPIEDKLGFKLPKEVLPKDFSEEERTAMFLNNCINQMMREELIQEQNDITILKIIDAISIIDFKNVYTVQLPCFLSNEKKVLSVWTMKILQKDFAEFIENMSNGSKGTYYLYTLSFSNDFNKKPKDEDYVILRYAKDYVKEEGKKDEEKEVVIKTLGIFVDGVLRDNLSAFDKMYRKIYIHNPSLVQMTDEFQLKEPTEKEYEEAAKKAEKLTSDLISLPIDTDDLLNHYKFEEEVEVFKDYSPEQLPDVKKIKTSREVLESFMYEKYPFQIFGDAEEYPLAMDQINRIQAYGLKNNLFETVLLTNLKSAAISANYFFLHKTGSRIKKVVVVDDIEDAWKICDVVVDATQETFGLKPDGKKSVRIIKPYNQYAKSDYSINSIKELNNEMLLKKLFEN